MIFWFKCVVEYYTIRSLSIIINLQVAIGAAENWVMVFLVPMFEFIFQCYQLFLFINCVHHLDFDSFQGFFNPFAIHCQYLTQYLIGSLFF